MTVHQTLVRMRGPVWTQLEHTIAFVLAVFTATIARKKLTNVQN